MVYIGVDLHRKKSQVAAIDPDGKLVFNRKVRTGPAEMQQLIDELRPQPIQVAFEATFGWGWFADLLAELGIPAHMAHPLATKAISSARVKNDAVDAKTLAHLLRTNLLPEGWIAPPEVREARRQVRMRAGLVRVRAKLKAQVHALLGEHGLQPDVVDLFSNKGRENGRSTRRSKKTSGSSVCCRSPGSGPSSPPPSSARSETSLASRLRTSSAPGPA